MSEVHKSLLPGGDEQTEDVSVAIDGRGQEIPFVGEGTALVRAAKETGEAVMLVGEAEVVNELAAERGLTLGEYLQALISALTSPPSA